LVHTDLVITGKLAQFGRGALADVSDKILAMFVENLNKLIAAS
jgi:carbon monoxide dehydrogenase subunit G